MKKRFLVITLIVSLVFNLAFIGALGYRLWFRRHKAPSHSRTTRERVQDRERFAPPPELEERIAALRSVFIPKVRSHRKDLSAAREDLISLFEQDNPDSMGIETVLHRIGQLQLNLDREVVFYMLQRKAILPPEHRDRFLEGMKRRLRDDRRSGPDPRGTSRRRETSERKPQIKKEE